MKVFSKVITMLCLAGVLSFGALVPMASAADVCLRVHQNADGGVTISPIPCPS